MISEELDACPKEFAHCCPLRSGEDEAEYGSHVHGAQDVPAVVPSGGDPPLSDKAAKTFTLSYPKWCADLLPSILKSRTDFGAFVAHTMSLYRRLSSRSPSTPALFPVPLHPNVSLDRMPAGLSSAKRRRLHLGRAVHCVCMALNFWHGGFRWPDDSQLQREPNSEHFALFRRVASLIRSDGLAESFELTKTGRKTPELIARLSQLSDVVTAVGSCGASYDRTYPGLKPEADLQVPENIVPFTDLDASRLALYGRGHWNVTGLLSDELVLAYREPRSLLAGLELDSHPLCRDKPSEVAALAHVWDKQGLLGISQMPRPIGSLVKIFNCKKSALIDRQIGDRRGQNSYECRVRGPSSDLPAGTDLMDLQVDVKTEKVVLIISDRKDYYHQISAGQARWSTNAVGPAIPLDLLSDTEEFKTNGVLSGVGRGRKRLLEGDMLQDFGFWHPGECTSYEPLDDKHAYVCFKAILQGDHAGVEIATEAHSNWLRRYGLLDDFSRLTASRSLRSSTLLQGLVIDDYFAASIEPRDVDNAASKAADCYRKAAQAYDDAELLGSPQKDVVGANEGKLIGAFVNSEKRALDRGLCTVGSPPEKRIALSHITLQICRLSATTDGLHLCLVGNWVSVVGFRRPLMSILDKSFHLVNQHEVSQSASKIIGLPRAVAQELVLLAVLVPLAVSDLGASYFPGVFSTDASKLKGAICVADAPKRTVAALWKSCKTKGSYTRLLSPAQEVLRENATWDEIELMMSMPQEPQRPLANSFDFIEIFSGSSKVTAEVATRGLTVGPPLDIGISLEYNLRWIHVMEWITFMIAEKRLKAFLASPPCTSFSIMRRPKLRSPLVPFGYDPSNEQTKLGNILGQRTGQALRVAAVNGAAGIAETPYSSYLKYLPGWRLLRAMKHAEEVRCDSCQFGSIHLKPFRFLGINISLQRLSRRCQCRCKHVKIEGSYTKASATYVPDLVAALADCIFEAVCNIRDQRSQDLDLQVEGLENQLVNEVSLSSKWRTVAVWNCKVGRHINLLEEEAILKLVNRLSRLKTPTRAVCLTDSHVVRGATSKGRSSSRALTTLLRKIGSTMVAAAIYLTLPFVPTRWNPSDDPTRDAELRGVYGSLSLEDWEEESIYLLSEMPKLRRWASNWVRLVLRSLGEPALHFSDRSTFRQVADPISLWSGRGGGSMDFDQTLGFPGEGPPCLSAPNCISPWISIGLLACLCSIALLWTTIAFPFWIFVLLPCCRGGACCWLFWCCLCFEPSSKVCFLAEAMPVFPKTAGEFSKAAQRAARPPVPSGRPVLPATQHRRAKLLDEFLIWSVNEGLDMVDMINRHSLFIDDINLILERYGRQMYQAGLSYAKYAETINAVTSWKPAIRRSLQGAWDFGYAWNRHEPGSHHSAMPGPVALAVLATAMMWGWTRFAGCFALMWAGLLRPGELLSAKRSDLLLPSDGDKTLPFGLLAIDEPKTRFATAKHQSAKIDMADMLEIVETFLGPLPAYARLWPMSGSTLRSRFRDIQKALSLPLTDCNGAKPLELASIRAGSATWIMQTLESGDLLQRRGRWANRKMMDIYVQEVTALIFLQKVPSATRQQVLTVAQEFLLVKAKAFQLHAANIPTTVWYRLFSVERDNGQDGKSGKSR